MNDLVRLNALSKRYPQFELHEVSFAVPQGSVVGFVGSNGAGKTTTLKILLGLVMLDSGSFELFGESFERDVMSERFCALKQRIGVVFDSCSFPEEMKVGTVAKLVRSVYNTWDDETFCSYLRRFDIDTEKTVNKLSRGMGMKLSLACALAHDSDLLILDEATAGLDPLAREEVLDILRDYCAKENRGVLISSHITSDLDKIADYIVCIDAGRIVFSQEKDAISDRAGIARCRRSEFETLIKSGFFKEGSMHYQRHEYEIDVLVPDRFVFAEHFSDIAIDRIDTEGYMSFMLKGDLR